MSHHLFPKQNYYTMARTMSTIPTFNHYPGYKVNPYLLSYPRTNNQFRQPVPSMVYQAVPQVLFPQALSPDVLSPQVNNSLPMFTSYYPVTPNNRLEIILIAILVLVSLDLIFIRHRN